MWRKLYVLYGGAAGPGKSRALRWALVQFHVGLAQRGIRNVRTGLFCESYPTLQDRQISKIVREFPAWLGKLRQSRDEGYGFYFNEQYGGGYIALRNLDDPAKYASSEFAAEAVDEITKNPRQTFDDLRFRLRWPGVEHNPFLAASNPGSIGHAWVKKLWIDGDFSGDDENLDANEFEFVPAKAGDNPYLPASYWKRLNSLPPAMRRAMLDGDWNVFEGQVFGDWREDLHVCEPFPIPDDWPKWVSIDYGYSAPFCALWLARSPDRRLYVYRERYTAGWRARQQAIEIRGASRNEDIELYAADPSMWAKREGLSGDSLAEEYAAEGIQLQKANNDRRAGLEYVREDLNWKALPGGADDDHGRVLKPPRLQVFNTCRNLIRTLPALPYDKVRVEDVDTRADDHGYDALRYGLAVEHQRIYQQPESYGELVWE